MRDFWAGVYIALQNFEAKYSTLVYILFFAFIALLLIVSLVKTVRASAKQGKTVELREQKADEKLKDHASRTLRKIIKYKTVANNYAEMQELFNYLREAFPLFCKEASLKVLDNGVVFCLYGKKRTENPVLLCAHLDVVPEGDGWEHGAFDGTREDGKIYGRGAVDCKGPAVAIFEALEKLVFSEVRPDRDIYFALGLDEEGAGTGSLNIAQYFEEQGIKFDIILGEGGYIAKSHIDSRNYPIALIGVGERESCIFKITAEGKNGHSGRAIGRSAANVLAEALCRIEAEGKRFCFTPIAESYLRDSLPAMDFKKRFVIANLPYTKGLVRRAFCDDLEAMAMMQSTVTPTQLLGSAAPNMLSNTAEAVLNAYLLPSEDGRKMLDFIKKLLADLPVKIELTDANTQYKTTSPEHPLYKLLCDTLRERFSGLPCTPYLSTGCSNVRHYAGLSDCVITFSPIVMEKKTAFSAHGANERISEESLAAAAEVYARFLMKL